MVFKIQNDNIQPTSYSDVAGSRSSGTTYQNNNDVALVWICSGSGGGNVQISSNGSTWINLGVLGAPGQFETSYTAIVPVGWRYRIASGAFSRWVESNH